MTSEPLRFRVTTDKEGRRISRKNYDEEYDLPDIIITGASTTFGYNVNDQETFSWLLQEQFTQHNVHNYSSNSYTSYQQLLVIENVLKRKKPAMVILTFSPSMDFCNITNRIDYLKICSIARPACLYRNKKFKRYKIEAYKKFPGSKSSCLALMYEFFLNSTIYRKRMKCDVILDTIHHTLLTIKKLCENNDIALLIACVEKCSEFHQFFYKNGFCWCIANQCDQVPFDKEPMRWRYALYDTHPNANAHRHFANIIGDAAKTVLSGKLVSPPVELIEIKTTTDGQYAADLYPLF
jgi:hypothetical protein